MHIERVEVAARRAGVVIALATLATLAGGCLGTPKLEDRWTRIDLVSSSLSPNQAIGVGAMVPITMSSEITYRSIVTGYAVAELRASTSIAPTSVLIGPNAPRLRMAQDIDRILANSVSMGRGIRAITGWDHLIQRVDFSFNASLLAAPDTTGLPASGVFLLCYIGSGVKIELPSGADSIAITPLPSTNYELLPVGMPLTAGP
jgi:hypothetical protein